MKEKNFALLIGILFFIPSSFSCAYRYEYEYLMPKEEISIKPIGFDKKIEEGEAKVIESSLFKKGVRLECRGTKEKPAIAAAIYKIEAPEFPFLTIEVEYQDISNDDEIAGRITIKGKDKNEIIFGDTFLFSSEKRSEKIFLEKNRYVIDNTIEIQIRAEYRDILEIESIKVESCELITRRIRRYYPRYYNWYYDWYDWYDWWYWPGYWRVYPRYYYDRWYWRPYERFYGEPYYFDYPSKRKYYLRDYRYLRRR